jgi:membrane protein DedA with SNARE-associated domain
MNVFAEIMGVFAAVVLAMFILYCAGRVFGAGFTTSLTRKMNKIKHKGELHEAK